MIFNLFFEKDTYKVFYFLQSFLKNNRDTLFDV